MFTKFQTFLHFLGCMAVALSSSQVIDLSWEINPTIPKWPTVPKLEMNVYYNGTKDNLWYQAEDFSMGTHISTHLDAPAHFYKDGWSVDEIPWSRLVSRPVHVIDVREKVFPQPGKVEMDYLITVADIDIHETAYGPVMNGSVVLFLTGWGRFWNKSPIAYKGTGTNNTSDHRFPGLSKDAADFLSKDREVYGVGIDTLSIDLGMAKYPEAHVALSSRNVYILENVANLESLTTSGAILHVGVLKLGGGASGAPARLIAELPSTSSGYTACAQQTLVITCIVAAMSGFLLKT